MNTGAQKSHATNISLLYVVGRFPGLGLALCSLFAHSLIWRHLGTFREQSFVDWDRDRVPPRHLHPPGQLQPSVAIWIVLEQSVEALAGVVVEPGDEHEALLEAHAVGAVHGEGQVVSWQRGSHDSNA